MAQFLSDEWIDEMVEATTAAGAGSAVTSAADLRVQQVVTTEPVVRYWVWLDHGTVRMGHGLLDGADVVLETDRHTAVGLATGTISAQDAVTSGGLQISGDVAAMIRQAASLAAIEDLSSDVRHRTTYDEPEG